MFTPDCVSDTAILNFIVLVVPFPVIAVFITGFAVSIFVTFTVPAPPIFVPSVYR